MSLLRHHMAVKMQIQLIALVKAYWQSVAVKNKEIIENEYKKNNGFEVIYFSFISSNEPGENGKKIWVPVRHRTTDLWIRRCELRSFTTEDSTVSKASTKL